jgi:hypothetical protein
LVLFSGGDPTCNDEIFSYYKKWSFLFNTFLSCVNRKNGDWMLLPFSGGFLNQPYKTMTILTFLQGMWITHIQEENERAMNRR